MPDKSKKAYPNIEGYQNIPATYDTDKWLQAVKTIYYEERKNPNISRNEIIRVATKGWKITEIVDFLNWLRFYEEGTHLKYKFAHNWYGDADVGYLLPIKPDKKEEPSYVDGKNIDFARDSVTDQLSSSEKKKIIEKQRNKIIGRLDSTEKLLRSDEGQLFADKEFAVLLESIYELKKKIQMVNKKSSSNKLYEDMIVREANVLVRKGFQKAANVLYSLSEDKAQEPKAEEPKDDKAVTPAPPAPPMVGGGLTGELPTTSKEEPFSKGIDDFLSKLDGKVDKNEDDDVLEVEDQELVVEAQVEPTDNLDIPEPPAAEKPAVEKSITEKPVADKLTQIDPKDALKPIETPKAGKDFDKLIDTVFSNVTIEDVIAKFEDIAKFHKTREIPRQLAFADIVLDRLNLAPLFPELAEATNKSLESNNYILSRIENIIAKLRGTIQTKGLDMSDKEKQVSPEVAKAKQVLQEQDDKEAERKKMRKDLENESLKNSLNKETPEIEVQEDLEDIPEEVPTAPAAKPALKPAAPVI